MDLIKKHYASFLLVLFLFSQKVSAAPILEDLRGNKPGTDELKAGDLGAIAVLIGNIRSFISGIAAGLAVLFIIIGGVMYITSAGDQKKVEKGKQFLTYAIAGLIMVILAEVILRIFVEKILGGTYQ